MSENNELIKLLKEIEEDFDKVEGMLENQRIRIMTLEDKTEHLQKKYEKLLNKYETLLSSTDLKYKRILAMNEE